MLETNFHFVQEQANESLLTERLVGHDLHSDLGRWRDGVVGVGKEARVHTAGQSLARRVERRLGNSVVLREELENNGITNGHVVQLIWLISETARAANLDSMAGSFSWNSSSLALLDGRGGASRDLSNLASSTGGNGLGDGDLLVDGGGRSAVARVGPNDDDFGARVDTDTLSLHALDNSDAAVGEFGLDIASDDFRRREDVGDSSGHGERSHGHGKCRRELHIDGLW